MTMKPSVRDQIGENIYIELKNIDIGETDHPVVWRVEIPTEETDTINWLNSTRIFPRFYWADRNGTFEVASAGRTFHIKVTEMADTLDVFEKTRSILAVSHPDTRFYGGMRFDQARSAGPEWDPFGFHYVFIPRLEMIRNKGQTTLFYNFLLTHKEQKVSDMIKEIEALFDMEETSTVRDWLPISWCGRFDSPDIPGWQRNIEKALNYIHLGILDKIVLARRTDLQFSQEIDPLALFKKMKEKYSNSFCFYFQLQHNLSFLGVTPELLYSRDHEQLFSEAIAGTRPRSEDPEEDEQLGKELAENRKEIDEHGWVLNEVEKNLEHLCESSRRISSNTVMKQTYVQHLYAQFKGVLKSDIYDSHILDAMHPTPAVAGSPKATAMRYISELEEFDRGWYAGPVGWLSKNSSTFAVAIRSALVQTRQMFIYAGAGIVKESRANEEWQEIENKIKNYTRLITAK
jgi:menaquinone-specific isochorismate synthase